jgi:hypothetical protein
LAVPSPAFAWGPVGHEIVARIAASELTPKARHRIETLLGAPAADSMAAVASWADWQTGERPETRPWHYVNIELGAAAYDAARDCPHDACIVAQIQRERRILADLGRPPAERVQALKFLLHFVGDLHQPLHCADNHDRGGNDVAIAEGETVTNLHAVWDRLPARTFATDPRAAAGMLASRIALAERAAWTRGTVEQWADESFAIARDRIYGRLKRPSADADPAIMRVQLEKAGVRLAVLLNRALR